MKELSLENTPIDHIRYQRMHRTVSALIEARRFNAENALMLVHSFSKTDEWFEDYEAFISLFGLKGKRNCLSGPKDVNGVDLYFGWVRRIFQFHVCKP